MQSVFRFSLQPLPEIFLTLRKLQSSTFIGVHANNPLFLSDVKETSIFSTDVLKDSIS